MKSDSDLLQTFFRQRDQNAFAEVVHRHIAFVYSAALRQVNGDTHLAHDITQNVFTALARKADQLSKHIYLAGWLYTSAHHAAANCIRSEARRRKYEKEAYTMHLVNRGEPGADDWEQLRPVLDEAMLELDAADRDAVLRRYFSGQSFATIGHALKVSQEAARKRVDRALDRLQESLARRGVNSPTSALGLVLTQQAVSAAPVGLGTVVTQAVAAAGAVNVAGSILFMNKIAMGLTAAVAAGLVGLLFVEQRNERRLEQEIALQRQQLGALESSLARSRRDIADQPNRLAGAPSVQLTPPLVASEPITPATATERLQLDSSYAGMFRRLRLDREKLAALKELLVLRQRSVHEAQSAAKMRGRDLEEFAATDIFALISIAARDVDENIRGLLGDGGLEYVQTYDRTQRYRFPLGDLEKILVASGEPLSPEQSDQLVAWSAAESDPQLRMPIIPDGVLVRAASLLSPLQQEKLKFVHAQSIARMRMTPLNEAAAAKGLLRLLPQSAQEYAEWARKSADHSKASPKDSP